MRLFATLVPPPRAVAELRQAVAAVPAPSSQAPRRGLIRRSAPSTPGPRLEDQLDLMPERLVQTPIAIFGNLTNPDATRLTELIVEQSATWTPPVLRMVGAEALSWPGDTWVWSRLEGDLDALDKIASGIGGVAERLKVFVDRRRFHPLMPIGQVNDATDGDYLEALVAALEGFAGTAWRQPVLTLVQGAPPDSLDRDPLVVHTQVTLGG